MMRSWRPTASSRCILATRMRPTPIISSRCPILSRSTIPSATRPPRARHWRRSRRSSAAFPDTPYAEDASQKVLVARDHLAGKEMEDRPLLLQAGLLSGRHQPLQAGGDRVSEHVPRRRKRSIASRKAIWHWASSRRPRRPQPCWGTTIPNSEWYKDAYQLVSSDGQAPVENRESWISKTFRAINPL